MEESFDDLHHAAVAGAEGTAWTMPEFCPTPLHPYYTLTSFDPLAASNHYESTSSHTTVVKEEPVYLDLVDVPKSPSQPSLCSVSSSDSYVHTKPKQHVVKSELQAPTSPVSVITKQRPSRAVRMSKASIAASAESLLSKHDLTDLKGTTAARSRKMTEEERRIMLHKRRLRNRASAARSREKRSRTLLDLTTEVEALIRRTSVLVQEAKKASEEVSKLKAKNVLLTKENELLKSELRL